MAKNHASIYSALIADVLIAITKFIAGGYTLGYYFTAHAHMTITSNGTETSDNQ